MAVGHQHFCMFSGAFVGAYLGLVLSKHRGYQAAFDITNVYQGHVAAYVVRVNSFQYCLSISLGSGPLDHVQHLLLNFAGSSVLQTCSMLPFLNSILNRQTVGH